MKYFVILFCGVVAALFALMLIVELWVVLSK